MKKKPLLAGLALWLGACGSEPSPPRSDPFFSAEEWRQIQTLSPLPELPSSPTNRLADDPKAARLGQALFFDESFSGPLTDADHQKPGGLGQPGERGKVSCASCHQGNALFTDARSSPDNLSLGAARTTRQTPSALNAAFFDFVLWDGRADSLWMQAIRPVLNRREHNFSLLELAHTTAERYKAPYEELFGPLPNLLDSGRFPAAGGPAIPEEGIPATPSWLAMTEADRDAVRRIAANFGKAIEAYERKLISKDAKFDRYAAGELELFKEPEKRGLKVFLGTARCVQCHNGPLFSDGLFHNLGLSRQNGPNVPPHDFGAETAYPGLLEDPFNGAGPYSDAPEAGRTKLLKLKAPDRGQFRTPSLRNVQLTAPYFHDGSRTGLTSVIEFYRVGGDPAGTFDGPRDALIQPIPTSEFQPTQVFDLQEFLWTLTGQPIDPSLTTKPT